MTNKVLSILFFTMLLNVSFAADSGLEKARKNIALQFEGVNAKDINKSPIPGLYQVSMPPRFFYASEDGQYVVDGSLIDMATKENISETGRNRSVAAAITAIGEDSMITFGQDTLKHRITVFTDIDCGYCRKLHAEVKKYNKAGIQVRYLAFPRAGLGSESFKKAEDVWCSKDKAAAMTKSKNGLNIKSEKCDSPVAEHYALGNAIGIRGTPAIVLENGQVIPGYIPAARLAALLNEKNSKSNIVRR